jgi:hypothetical protein
MSRNAFALIAAGAILLGALLLPGQNAANEWHLKRRGGNQVRFTVRQSSPGRTITNSSDIPIDRFRGLTFANGPAKFEYVQDAGRLICEGRFLLGAGSGTFTAVLDPDFVATLQRLGYEAPNENQAFDMLLGGFSLEFARAVKDAGLSATTADLLDLRNHGIDADYVRGVRAAGYRDLHARDLIDLRNHGVNPDFLADLRRAGYDLHTREIIDLRNHGVSPDYVRDLKDAGYSELPVGEIVNLRNHGVPADFVRDAHTLGYQFSTRELIDLRNHGVDGAYLRRMKESGMRNLTAAQIQKLRDHGID